ncbi:MAG: hypothetical protein ACXVEF_11275 [Polyangiales bacterium]
MRVLRGHFDEAICARWASAIRSAKQAWISDFGGEQFALGRAFYTHLETSRTGEYFDQARASDALVEQTLPGFQDAMRAIVATVTGAKVVARRGWCGPGVHVFPEGEKVAREGGVVHFDLEGLNRHHLNAHKPALSIVAMIAPPTNGGGLRLWDVRHPSDEDAHGESTLVEYRAGDVLIFDSYQLHQIQPFSGGDRVSATVHAAEIDSGLWETWF